MKKENGLLLSVVKGGALTLIVGLVSVLLFAVIVKFTAISDTAIKTTNQFIKVIAVFVGCFFTVRGKMGWLKGGVIGAVGIFLIYLIFSLLSGTGLFSLEMLADLGLSLVVGAISGVIAVNVKGKE